MKNLKLFIYIFLMINYASATDYERDNKNAIQACLKVLESTNSSLIKNGVLDDAFHKVNVIRYAHSQFIWLRFGSLEVAPKAEMEHLPPISCGVNKSSFSVNMLLAPVDSFSRNRVEYVKFTEKERESERISLEKFNGAELKIIYEKNYLYTHDNDCWSRLD